MSWPPLIERELRVALRKKKPARSRLIVASVCVGGFLLVLLFGLMVGSRNLGPGLHKLLCFAGFYVILRAPMLTAGALARERGNQTLGLLFLSGLSSTEVFLSKFLSAVMVAFNGLLAMVPVLALPFLMGGVSFDLFLATAAALPSLLLFVVAVSLLASVLTRDEGTAGILTGLLALLLCGAGPLFYWGQLHYSPAAKPSTAWLVSSPAYGPYLVWTALRAGPVADCWRSLTLSWAWSLLCLGLAAGALKKLWREREESAVQTGWSERWHQWLHGTPQYRRRLAGAWIDVNPFVWMAARDRQPAVLAWGVIGGIAALWLLCWAAWPARWPSVPNFVLTAILLNTALGWITRHCAARDLAQPRRDGGYELLLTTPLEPGEIVWGELEALRRRFQAPARAALALHVVMMLGGLMTRRWNWRALFAYFVIWSVLLAWSWQRHSGCWSFRRQS